VTETVTPISEAPAESSGAKSGAAAADVAPAETTPVAAAAPETPAAELARVSNSLSLLPQTDFFPAAIAPIVPPVEPVGAIAVEPSESPPIEATATAPVAPEAVVEAGASAATAEPEMIEVWRPAGRSERKPHFTRRPKPQHRNQAAAVPAAPATEGGTAEQPPAAAAEPKTDQSGREHHQPARGAAAARRAEGHDRQQRQDRQDKRDSRNQRDERGGRRERGGSGVERAERERYYAKPGLRMRQNKEADPNSPFAKLAALKQQLEDGAKERQ
jgi:ATP-dependent RNA helicase SUPV3L1/SUV3